MTADVDPDRARLAVAAASSDLAAMGDGARARRAGLPRDANPWDQWRPERRNWTEGWNHEDRLIAERARE